MLAFLGYAVALVFFYVVFSDPVGVLVLLGICFALWLLGFWAFGGFLK